LKFKLALSVRSELGVAIATVNRPISAGLERHFSLFATLGTYCGEHLASGPVAVAAISIAVHLSGLTARGAALGLVGIAFGLEELLLFDGEGECSPTIGTLERLFLKAHMDGLLSSFGW